MKSTLPSFAALHILFSVAFYPSCTLKKPTFPTGIYPKEMSKIPAPDAAAALVTASYKAEVFMKDMIWPSSIEFDASGNIYVA
jgi:hypothetical protein